MIRKLLQQLSSLKQGPEESYHRHNAQYEEVGKLEKERVSGNTKIETNEINGPTRRIFDLLALQPHIRNAIDVGSGTGWSSAALSSYLTSIIAIEPSEAAVRLARTLYPAEQYPNIKWVNGLAEQVIPTLAITTPTLFLTGCVLSHIRNKEVQKICAVITKAAPPGSILSFDECWGETEWHQLMWHVRTKDWWCEQLTGWELDFHGPVVPDKDTYKGQYHKGFWGVKK